MRDTIIGIFATLVLAAAGNTPGSVLVARETATARPSEHTSDAFHRAHALAIGSRLAIRLVAPDRSTLAVASTYQVQFRTDPVRDYRWARTLLFVFLLAAGILAAVEIVMRFRQMWFDVRVPLLIPSQHTRGPGAPVDLRPTESLPANVASAAHSPALRELVSVSAPPERTLAILPGRFEIVSGSAGTKEIRFVKVPGTDVVTFGRDPGETYMHVRVDSPTVSRIHATMRYTGRGWLLRNLSATNPVVLNGKALPVGGSEQELHDSDRVEMGEVTFRFWSQ
jgi:hypothetical protein